LACLEENTLFEYLCGGLAVVARAAVAEHAASCECCRRLIAAAATGASVPTRVRTRTESGRDDVGRHDNDDAAADRGDALLAGKYQLIRLLGAGGMGTVHEAVNTWTGRRVAVKQLRDPLAGDAIAAQRFMREARSASQIAHPNVVDILDLGRDPATGALFMVQELLDGVTLRRRLAERGALSVAEAAHLLAPALAALAMAHAAGLVHRDVKPDNIFLARDPRGGEITKLIDFGLSKQLRDGAELALTSRGRQLGTPYYMAPEQLRGAPDLDDRLDVWAIGVVLFEAVSGTRPFIGPSCHALIDQVLHQPAPRLAERAPAVPAAFDALVARALDRDPARRPGAAELGDALARLARERAPATRRPGARHACRTTAGPHRRSAVPTGTARPGACNSRGSRPGSR
jgi:serine/threonine-protein kinase